MTKHDARRIIHSRLTNGDVALEETQLKKLYTNCLEVADMLNRRQLLQMVDEYLRGESC